MNKWLLLLIVIGLGVIGWLDQDRIRMVIISHGYGHYLPGKLAPGTPNPASDAVKQAKILYPGLGVPNSALNQRFLALYNAKKDADPDFLTKDDWPVLLAQQAATELGVTAMPGGLGAPTAGSNPSTFHPSQLDDRPNSNGPKATIAPTVQLPGQWGSSLDQRPAPNGHH